MSLSWLFWIFCSFYLINHFNIIGFFLIIASCIRVQTNKASAFVIVLYDAAVSFMRPAKLYLIALFQVYIHNIFQFFCGLWS